MKYMKPAWYFVVPTLLMVGIGYILLSPLTFGICQDIYRYEGEQVEVNGRVVSTQPYTACHDTVDDAIGGPLFFGGIGLLAVSILLLFLPRKYFDVWLKFAMVYIPIATLIVATSPLSQGGGFIFSATRSMIAALFGIAYVVISLLIFAGTAISSKK